MNPISLEEQVLRLACSVFDAYSAVLFLPDDSGKRFPLSAYFSLGDHIDTEAVAAPGQSLVGWIIDNRRPMLLCPFDQPFSQLGYYVQGFDPQIKAFMGFPLPTGGALCVDSKRQYSFSEKDGKLLQLFADLISRQESLAIQTAGGEIPRYFAELGVIQDLRFRYRRWPVFLKNFLRALSEATDFDYCAFATLQEDGASYCIEAESAPLLLANGQMMRMPLGAGITGWVFANEQPVYSAGDVELAKSALFGKQSDMPDFTSAICLPVMVNKTCRGVLCLAHTSLKSMDESLRSFVRQAVDHLGLFLENLYLKNRLRVLLDKIDPPAKAPGDGRIAQTAQGDDNPK